MSFLNRLCYNSDMRKTFNKGFTLVEMALSMAFIGILSMAVVLIIVNTIASYRRGLTLNRVNTTGTDIVDDMRWAVSNSSSRAVSTDCYRYYPDKSAGLLEACVNDGAKNFVTITKYANSIQITKRGGNNDSVTTRYNVPIYGAFCTGTYSYIWNSGYFEMDNVLIDGVAGNKNWAKLKYNNPNGRKIELNNTTRANNSDRPFRLLKVRDDYRSVCVSVVKKNNSYNLPANSELGNVFDITGYRNLSEEPIDLLLSDSDNDLALFDLYVAKPAESTTQKNMFYSVSFILGTLSEGIDIMASGSACVPPDSDGVVDNYDYCAINKFNFAMQANGEL